MIGKNLLLSCVALLLPVLGHASTRTVVFDFTNNYSNLGLTREIDVDKKTHLFATDVLQLDGVEIVCTPDSACALACQTPDVDASFRLFAASGAVVALSLSSIDDVISSVTLEGLDYYDEADIHKTYKVGDLSINGEAKESAMSITWTGEAAEVAIVASSNCRIGKMTVVVQTVERPDAPVIDPDGGLFIDTQQVSITAADGCTVRYTTDGTEPAAATGQVYEESFTLTESCTVKAIAVNSDGIVSHVAAADFVKQQVLHISSTAEFAAAPDNARVIFDCPLTAVFQSHDGVFTYVTDTTQQPNVCVWCADGLPVELARDDALKAGAAGTKTVVGDIPVLEADAATISRDVVSAIQAKTISDSDISPFEINDFVMSMGAVITAETSTSNDAPCLRSVRRRASSVQTATYSVDGGAYRMVNKFDVNVIEGDGRKFLGIIGMEDGEKVVYPTYVTLPTGNPLLYAPSATVQATDGCITVSGQWNTVTVLNPAGQVIAKDKSSVECPSGTYVVVIDGYAQKVAVK